MASTAAFHLGDSPVAGAPARVLVAEDNDLWRTAVCDLLETAGYVVSQAPDGRAALEVAERDRPDVVLLDVHMPQLHGYEVCRRLRRTFGFAIVIIFVSGSRTEPYDRVAGLDAGGDDYLIKPFDPGELLARIAANLRRLRASSEEAPVASSPLTPRQEEIVRLLARGADVPRIAAELVISPATVRKHIERIHKLLGVRRRAEVIAWAHASGLAERA